MKKNGKHKAAIGLTIVIVLFLTGVSYGAWSDTLWLRGLLTTANFSIEFGDKKDIEVYLITADSQSNIAYKEKVTEFRSTKNDNENITLTLKSELINKLKIPGYMLQVKYPLKTSDDSKIKAIKPIMADFSKPDDTVDVIPGSIKIGIDGEYIGINEDVNESEYEIHFNIYRQIETVNDNNKAVVYLEAYGFNELSPELSIEYSDLIKILPEYADIPYDNPKIDVQLEAEYLLEIPIGAEQFNSAE